MPRVRNAKVGDLFSIRYRVWYVGGSETIDVRAKGSTEALAELAKILKAKQAHIYHTVIGVDAVWIKHDTGVTIYEAKLPE